MSLLHKPLVFANSVTNLTGTPPAALVGTNFGAGANNADSSAVSLLSALSFDVHYLVVGIGAISLSTANSQALADILVDPAGGTSWSALINDLVCGFTPTLVAGVTGIQTWYHFPIYIKSGTSVGIQCRTRHTASINTGRAVVYAYGNPSIPMWWCGTGVESLGINAATSQGTNVTPGSSGAAGTWTSIGGTTSNPYGAIQFGLNGSDGSSTAIGYYWEFGYGSTRLPGSPYFYSSMIVQETAMRTGFNQWIPCNIPAGTQMQARGTASGTAEIHNVAIYGVY